MERRVLLAISLSFLVLMLYQTFIAPPPKPADRPAATAPAATTTPATPRAAQPVGGAATVSSAPAGETIVGESSEREVTLESPTVRATFSNRGGRISHWVLKKYRSDAGGDLDLVPSVPGAPKPFSLRLDDAALTARLNDGVYKTTVDGSTVRFDLESSDGLAIAKTFTLPADGYILEATVSVTRGGQALNPTIDWGPGLGEEIAKAKPASFLSPNYSTPAQGITHKDGKVVRLAVASASAEDGLFRYAGIDDHYFAALVLNQPGPVGTPEPLHFEHTPVVEPPGENAPNGGRYVSFSVRFAQPGLPRKFYVGPKAFDDLRGIDTELVRVINFGMFSWLAVPLLGALKWVHGYIGNWGWAIVVLTMLINLAMFPLRHKSVVSMRRMQEIQPQMKAIQDRYAKYKVTDPERQKMNEEVMALYKSKGVNPASGCLPMLLTLPFLFALYGMLSQAIEIRGAGFFGWIIDLSRPDPLFITPLIMGGTMFWQQRLTPSSVDPVQQRVMMIMPLMFTFMFLSYPSGLVIYWTISNVWGIGQQYFTTYLIGPPKSAKVAAR
jgi:YidC/Oxa1 family membrane protein insertase